MKASSGSIFHKTKAKETSEMSEPKKWECTTCGAMNAPAARYCAACGKSKA